MQDSRNTSSFGSALGLESSERLFVIVSCGLLGDKKAQTMYVFSVVARDVK